ncbi:unnamed protein product [Mytilus edulis]|uniref:Uncharacterized protein n=1 Tax=Mytilus edulis TaxID=6550 RepID=A0A8S3V4W3_MYTED|nr:unnamed protein product [Mytilus edulis]
MDIMLIYTFLIVNVVLTSSLVTKTFSLRDVTDTDENSVRVRDGKNALQKVTTENLDSRDTRALQIFGGHAPLTSDLGSYDLELMNRRKKRGWGSVIFTGVTSAIRLAGLGLTLTQALTEGCAYYPSICRDKVKMEHIERRLVSMRSEYDKLYLENKKEYLNLATSNTNNAYISYYINDTLRNMHTLQDLELRLSESLETNFPKLYEMFEASKNYTSQEYLDSVIGRLEYRLSDIRTMLKNEKHNQLIGLLVQYLVEAAVSRFINSFSKAYTQVLDAEGNFQGSVIQNLFNEDADVTSKPKTKGKFKLSSKLLKPLKGISKSLKNFKKTVKSMTLKKFGQQIKKLGSKAWQQTKTIGKTFKK